MFNKTNKWVGYYKYRLLAAVLYREQACN